MQSELMLLAELRRGNKEAFSILFTSYYKDLVRFGGVFLSNKMVCEDIVQSVFLNLWNDRASLEITTSLKSYLLTSVRNRCMNEIQHRNIVQEHASDMMSNPVLDEINTENYVLFSDLQTHFLLALQQVPEAFRLPFEMNRMQGMKYKDIAIRLNVSERTVEVRISKALEMLRTLLKDFLLCLVCLLRLL
ncbi:MULTISPECIES: RNA polymerase sigma-70 factor [Parabacteroides]|uniref:RNA polymerase sigma-70 factor n=1 Tax=Parabacteroides provencensis TaxID=1944636 RepID=UPI000C156A02|nr:RNA polymerase sigma-70 factor [Parabacteroides provencensis]